MSTNVKSTPSLPSPLEGGGEGGGEVATRPPSSGLGDSLTLEEAQQLKSATTQSQVLRSAGTIGFWTLCSRVLGMVRDVVSARMFGTSRVWDAFLIAFMIPNFLRRLVGEGALSNAFIPVYAQVLKEKGKEEADEVARVLATILIFGLTIFLAVVILGLEGALRAFSIPERLAITLRLLQILFPYIFFLSQVALLMGILNCRGDFLTPSLAPVVLNVVWTGAVLAICPFVGDSLEQKACVLSVFILISGGIQLLIQMMALRKYAFAYRLAFEWMHPAVRKVGGLLVPAIFTFAITQVSILFDLTLGFLIGEGANSSLWYGNRLMQFPLGIFGIAMGTVLLPTISHQAAAQDHEEVRRTLLFSLQTVFLIVIPASVGLMVLAKPIVEILFQRGHFDQVSTARTAVTLSFYCLGLFAYSGQKVMSSAFYAFQDTRTPFRIGAYSVGLDMVLNLILMGPLKEGGLALATAISGTVNFCLLIYLFQRRFQPVGIRSVTGSFLKITAASALMGGVAVWVYQSLGAGAFGSGLLAQLLRLLETILMGVASYAFFAYFLSREELTGALRHFRKRR